MREHASEPPLSARGRAACRRRSDRRSGNGASPAPGGGDRGAFARCVRVVRSLRACDGRRRDPGQRDQGLEADSLRRMSQVIAEESTRRAGRRAVGAELRGRSRARLADRGARRVGRRSGGRARAGALPRPAFRLYGSDDVAGVEIGGALKNVIAIAAGVVEGLGLGHNAMAALITRGLVEISRLACAEGGRRETLAGLSGLGDLVLTCTGDLSRNRHVGIELGAGGRCRTSSPACTWWPKACARPARRSRSARATASSCRSPRRWRRCSTAGARRAKRSRSLMRRRQRAESDLASSVLITSGRTKNPWVFSTRSSSRSRGRRSSSSSGSTRSSRAPTRRTRRSRPVDVETLEALEEALISADVGVAATERIVEAVRARQRPRTSRCAISSRTRSSRSSGRRQPAGSNGQRRTSC